MTPRRTPEHVLADESRIHVEGLAVAAGFSTIRVPVESDYGYDLLVITTSLQGFVEGGLIRIQCKAASIIPPQQRGDIYWVDNNSAISVQVERRHLRLWAGLEYGEIEQPHGELDPVILTVYDQSTRKAYWQFIQDYIQQHNLDVNSNCRIHVPVANEVSKEAMQHFRKIKNARYALASAAIRAIQERKT